MDRTLTDCLYAGDAHYRSAIPEWPRDNAYLRYAIGVPLEEI